MYTSGELEHKLHELAQKQFKQDETLINLIKFDKI